MAPPSIIYVEADTEANEMNVKIEITASSIAWWGAITGTIALIFDL